MDYHNDIRRPLEAFLSFKRSSMIIVVTVLLVNQAGAKTIAN